MEDATSLLVTQLSDTGQLTIPPEYRRALSLRQGANLALIRVGDALVLAPHDDALAAVTGRLEDQLRTAGCAVDDLLAAATKARAEMVREEFGEPAE